MTERGFDPERHCGARTRSGDPCVNVMGKGTSHVGVGRCKLHGGASPRAQAAGVAELARQQAAAAAAEYGLPIDTDPGQALLDEVSRSAGLVHFIGLQIRAIPGGADALVRGTKYVRRRETNAGTETITEVAPGLHQWVLLYAQERAHLTKVAAAALAAGVAERQIRLAEDHAEQMGALVAAALDAAGVKGEARRRAVEAAAARWGLPAGE